MLIRAVPKFINPTGNDPKKKPYKEKRPDPTRLIHRNFMTELIKRDIKTKSEARYPNHSNQLISN